MTPTELSRFVNECTELGVAFFDHADVYASYRCEELFGAVLEGNVDLRDQIQLITKFGIKESSPQ